MKIAIIKLSALGDIIHASIVLQFIKKHIPNALIDWICEERFSEILQNHEHINSVISINLKEKKIRKTYKILKEAKKNGYDVAIDLQGLLKSAIVARLVCKNVAGFDKNSIRERLATIFYTQKLSADYSRNIILRNLDLVSNTLGFAFTCKEIDAKKPCFLRLKKEVCAKKEKKSILITIGSSWQSKMYPFDLHVQLVWLLKEFAIFLVYGSLNEKKIAQAIAQNSHATLLDKMTLGELFLKMNDFDLIIGPDSGITHMAWAQNLPSITIYGPTPSHRNSYQTKQNAVVDCGRKIDAKNINKDNNCIQEIKPEVIEKLAREILWI